MNRNIFKLLLIFVLSAGFLAGCFKAAPPVKSLADADRKFIEICKDDYDLKPKITRLKNTLYIYLPLNHEILRLKAKDKDSQKEDQQKKEHPVLDYVKTTFAEEAFNVQYHVSPYYPPDEPKNYRNEYREEYTEKKNNLDQAILRTYGELLQEKLPGDVTYTDAKKDHTHSEVVRFRPKSSLPDFVIIVITDTINGIEMRFTLYFPDFIHVLRGTLAQDEYMLRQLYELDGNMSSINDLKGKYFPKNEMTWPTFLSKQINHRINFKFKTSDFPPSDDIEAEILNVIARTVRAYNFDDFQSIHLHDLRNELNFSFDKSELKNLGKE